MSLAVIRYNAGNVQSVIHALNRLGVEAILTDDPSEIEKADKVIFPGVGEARSTMSYLKERGLDQVIRNVRKPLLGICLGLQLLCSSSEENETECLGIFDVPVRRFPATGKVPHMGWNNVRKAGGKLFSNMPGEAYFYFVHSYYAESSSWSSAETEYLVPFSAGLERDNFFAVQFHPEKSGDAGEAILRNFLKL